MRATLQRMRSQRGAALVWLALSLLLLLCVMAIGVDMAKLAATKTQLQNAADAAALAGASSINPATGALVPDSAVTRACYTSAQNSAFADVMQPVVLAPGDVSFPHSNRVKVTVRRSASDGTAVIPVLAQVLGIDSLDVTASAEAEADTAGTVCKDLMPMAVVPPPGGDFQVGCAYTYPLKYTSETNVSGNFGLIAYPSETTGPCAGGSTGANMVRCRVINGYNACVQIGDVVSTEPGNEVGPFDSAMNQRFNSDTDTRQNICYSDYLSLGQGNGRRIVVVPIVRAFDNGRSTVTIDGFATFFLTATVQGGGTNSTVYGQFLYRSVSGSGGGSGTGAVAYSLHLVPVE